MHFFLPKVLSHSMYFTYILTKRAAEVGACMAPSCGDQVGKCLHWSVDVVHLNSRDWGIKDYPPGHHNSISELNATSISKNKEGQNAFNVVRYDWYPIRIDNLVT